MTRIQTMWAAFYAAALSMRAVPMLALAQAQGRAPAGTAPGDTTTTTKAAAARGGFGHRGRWSSSRSSGGRSRRGAAGP